MGRCPGKAGTLGKHQVCHHPIQSLPVPACLDRMLGPHQVPAASIPQCSSSSPSPCSCPSPNTAVVVPSLAALWPRQKQVPSSHSALPPSSCQHHQKEHLTENKPFFFPLVLAAHLSLARGRRSCQRLNLTHPFNLGGRNTFVPDNVHQMVAPGAPVAAVPDGWATGASPDLCLYVICIAAGGFSSRRQLRQHQPGRSDSPHQEWLWALQPEVPGPVAVLASWHLRL